MSATPFIIQLSQVDADIDNRRVLHDISLEIAPGRHLGIVGANGSGKSTLLALIAGRRWPAPGRGYRRYDFGHGIETDAVTARERIALLGHELQDLYFARRWNYRARDIVLSGLTRSEIPKRHVSAAQSSEAESLLQAMHLAGLADRRLLELSRGEQRRVLIARALAFRPALLLLDEPASGLDVNARWELQATLEQAAVRTTLVIAAHDPAELPAPVARLARLTDGRLSPQAAQAAAAVSPASDAAAATPGSASPDRREVVIAVERASVWLDGHPILRELGWQLLADEHWLIEGPNGAGKSTLLRLLHGELRPAVGGSISWPGLGHPRDVWSLRRRIALVSPELQARYLYPTTVFDAVASGIHASIGAVRPLSAGRTEEVQALLKEFRLDSLRERLLTSLSYGQRHRTLLARTLATSPRVVLLDEPWEGLDAKNTELVGEVLSRRMQAGTQVICVSHVGARGLPLNRRLQLGNGSILSVDGSAAPRGNSASAPSRAKDSRRR